MPVFMRLIVIIGLASLWLSTAFIFSQFLVEAQGSSKMVNISDHEFGAQVPATIVSHIVKDKEAVEPISVKWTKEVVTPEVQEKNKVVTPVFKEKNKGLTRAFKEKNKVVAPVGKEKDKIVTPAVNGTKEMPWYTKFPMRPPEVPPGRKVCFVHVGKTAGSTLACYFGFRYPACGKNFAIPLGRLPRFTTNVMHTTLDDCANGDFNYYLFILRNPLKRIISWFQYEKIRKDQKDNRYKAKAPLFVECYSTLNELAEKGLGRKGKQKSVCQNRASMAIKGEQGFSTHNKYNFGFYLSQIPANRKIIAIRTEHLNDDWNSAEKALGGNHSIQTPFEKRNVSAKKEDPLSPLAIANLCEALCEEFQVYKRILRQAENITPEQAALSIAEVQESCPLEPMKIRSCQRTARSDSES